MSEQTERLTGKPNSQAIAVAVEHAHPGPSVYLKVAAVLVVLTAFEIGVYYLQGLGPVMTPILLGLAAAKFALVALFYMHLKFDSPLFARLFILGLAIAATILMALLALFAYHSALGT